MRRLVPAVALIVALAAAAGAWQLLSARPHHADRTVPVATPQPTAPPARPAPPAATSPAAESKPVPYVPRAWRGQILRKRVRHFPEKLLALTFDDGPDPKITPLVLKALAQYNAHATFFVLGKCAKTYPQFVKQEVAAGHAIGSHSYSHPSSTSAEGAVAELDKTATIIQQLTGRKPQLFRPPYGITKGNLCQTALKEGYTAVLWTISTADSNPIGPEVIARNAIHTPNGGDIVLMHDGKGHVASAKALPQILRELTAAGFRFVTIPELLQAWTDWQAKQKAVSHAHP